MDRRTCVFESLEKLDKRGCFSKISFPFLDYKGCNCCLSSGTDPGPRGPARGDYRVITSGHADFRNFL